MATFRITKRSVEAVPVPRDGSRTFLWDDLLKGFGVMVTPAGSRSYLVQYRIGGRGSPTRRYTIGKHGSPWTAEKARDRATDLLMQIRQKIDPLNADRERLEAASTKQRDDERLAFSDYADFFIKRHAEARKLRSVEDIRAVFRRDLKPYFKNKPVPGIRRTDVQACLDLIGERSGSAANKAHKWLRKMLAFAVDRGDLASSPMESMGPPHQEGKRQRVLRGNELAIVWNAANDLGEPWASFVQLMTLTGQRLREVAGMLWEEVDLEQAVWVIPGARTKNKRNHLVPLSPSAVSILKALQPAEKLRKGPVLSTNGRTAISGFSKCKAALDNKVQDLLALSARETGDLPIPLEPWVFHDLRRSLATGCQGLGFPIEHTEAVLNHVSGKRGGLAAIYQLHEYRDEKTAALNAWARHVEALISGDGEVKVVPFVRGRG
jgi:integrase